VDAPGWNLSTKIDTLNLTIINGTLFIGYYGTDLPKNYGWTEKSKEQENYKLSRIERSKNTRGKPFIFTLHLAHDVLSLF
jgi:hypothetical protein